MTRTPAFLLLVASLLLVATLRTAHGGLYSGVKSADQQCIDLGYSGGLCGGQGSDICAALTCADYYQRATIMNRPLDGTGCGSSKVCISGVCQTVDPSDANSASLPQRPSCRSRGGPQG